ncbi:MAG TPA: hypothetical protein VH040_09385 [Usitatibacter sp.]|jgi:hypothetical protein|nr:hypothetical protein [Usitatibacter sp.]
MATSRKAIFVIGGAALLLGACASDPYYNGYNGYYGDNSSYGYVGGPAYYDPYYTGPSVGFGLAWNDRDGGDRWRRDRDIRGDDRDWRGANRSDGGNRGDRANRADRGGDRGDHDGGHDGGNGSTGENQRG